MPQLGTIRGSILMVAVGHERVAKSDEGKDPQGYARGRLREVRCAAARKNPRLARAENRKARSGHSDLRRSRYLGVRLRAVTPSKQLR